MSGRDYMSQAKAAGMNMDPQSKILRPRKFLNRHAKWQKRQVNLQERADVNAARSNDPKGKPTWHGIGHA